MFEGKSAMYVYISVVGEYSRSLWSKFIANVRCGVHTQCRGYGGGTEVRRLVGMIELF